MRRPSSTVALANIVVVAVAGLAAAYDAGRPCDADADCESGACDTGGVYNSGACQGRCLVGDRDQQHPATHNCPGHGPPGAACSVDNDCQTGACDTSGGYGCTGKCLVTDRDASKGALHNCLLPYRFRADSYLLGPDIKDIYFSNVSGIAACVASCTATTGCAGVSWERANHKCRLSVGGGPDALLSGTITADSSTAGYDSFAVEIAGYNTTTNVPADTCKVAESMVGAQSRGFGEGGIVGCMSVCDNTKGCVAVKLTFAAGNQPKTCEVHVAGDPELCALSYASSCSQDGDCSAGNASGACDTSGIYNNGMCKDKCLAPDRNDSLSVAHNCPGVEPAGADCTIDGDCASGACDSSGVYNSGACQGRCLTADRDSQEPATHNCPGRRSTGQSCSADHDCESAACDTAGVYNGGACQGRCMVDERDQAESADHNCGAPSDIWLIRHSSAQTGHS